MKVVEMNLDLGDLFDVETYELIVLYPGNKVYPINKLVEKMKLHETKFPISKYVQQVVNRETLRPIYNLHYECRSYWVTNLNGEMLTPKLPAISNELIHYGLWAAHGMHLGEEAILSKEHVKTYIDIKFGKRAPRHFWKSMTLVELMDICRFEVRYMQNIKNLEEARAFNVSNFLKFNIPAWVTDTYKIKFYDVAATARGAEGISGKPWLMYTSPRNYRMYITDSMIIDAISWVLKEHNISIKELKIRHLKISKMNVAFTYFNNSITNLRRVYASYQEGHTDISLVSKAVIKDHVSIYDVHSTNTHTSLSKN
jgi:hypothetical protein